MIAREGDDGIFFLVLAGQVALKHVSDDGEHVVGIATAGDVVGADAFLEDAPRPQSATAVAVTDVTIRRCDAAALRRLIAARPDVQRLVRIRAEYGMVERLVRASTTFEAVAAEELRGLVHTVDRRAVAAGEIIIRQGEAGSEAFVIVDGSVDVVDENTQHTLATLGKGALFGEVALINDAARNATVSATEATTLLVLRRDPLITLLQTNAAAKARMIDLLNARDRPLRAASIEMTRQSGADGSDIVVLKNPENHKFFRLSGDSLFLWDHADGTNTIRDLTTALFTERRHFAPQMVISTIARLRTEGFLRATSALQAATSEQRAGSVTDRVLDTIRRVLTATAHHHNVDGGFASLYRLVGPLLFRWPSAVVLTIFALAGMALFALSTPKAVALLWSPHGVVSFVIFLLPAYALLIILHELGHGLAVKAIGRKVESVGVGWYWFGPVAFVDTSDSWSGTRAQRVLVSAAGLAMNLLLAAIASCIAFFSPFPIVAIAAWQFALTSYIGVLENLNPLLEFDGYYMLADILDRPNLRRQSLQWMGSQFRHLFRQPGLVRGHGIEFAYAIGAFCYILFAAGQSMLFYHVIGQQQLARIVPASVAAVLAWVFPILLSVAALLALLAEVRKVRDAAAAG